MTEEDIKKNFNLKLLRENGLGGLATKSSCIPYKAIDFAYPGRFKPCEFKMSLGGIWDSDETKLEAIKWLVKEKLKFSNDDIRGKLNKMLFEEYGLNGLIY